MKKTEQQVKELVWNDSEIINGKNFVTDINGNFYYGFLNPKWIEDVAEVKGEKKVVGKRQIKVPILIMSNNTYLEYNYLTSQKYKLNINSIPSYLPHRWKLEYQQRWLNQKIKKQDGFELITKIKTQYQKYLYIRDLNWYYIHGLWDIGTYFYQLFEAYPLFELRGISGTSKTKTMNVSSMITFNGGTIMVNPSESTLFREKDEIKGASYVDEAEKLFFYNKNTKQYESDTRVEIINASYTKDAKVPRQEKIGNKFYTRWYSPYSPTMLSSINGLYGATETRAITRITTKSPNEDTRGESDPAEDRNLPVWDEIRDSCYRFALENWKEIYDSYINFPKDIGLKRRDYQIWKPLLVIAKYINRKLYDDVLDFAKKLTEIRTDDQLAEGSMDYLCLSALKNCLKDEKLSEKNIIYVNLIKLEFCKLKGDEQGKTDIYLNRTISQHLDKLGFKELRKRGSTGNYFVITKEIFNEIVTPLNPSLIFEDLSSLSTSSTLNKEKSSVDSNVDVDRDKSSVDRKESEKSGKNGIFTRKNVDSEDDVDVFEEMKKENLSPEEKEIVEEFEE